WGRFGRIARESPALIIRGILERSPEGVVNVLAAPSKTSARGSCTFVNLEDESGLVNVICSTGVWGRFGRIARESPALIIRGILERSPEGVVNVLA
ncbi:hypothetical protein CTI14_62150, partial [Methylobacterium radiotolerans]